MDAQNRLARARGDGDPSGGAAVPPLICGAHACFLDIDGTLLELADTPEGVRVDPSLVRMLEEVARACGGAVALISGRPISDMDRLLVPLRLPAAGQHGLERRSASGSVHWHGPLSSEIPRLLGLARAWASTRPGLLVEDKSGTFAVHYRNAPHLGEEVLSFMQNLLRRSAGNYCLQTGKMVAEITPEGRNKGTAVAEFMTEPPFAGRKPVFIGDDTTDECAFPVVAGLGGITIKVGSGETSAHWRLRDVSAVHAWIAQGITASAKAKTQR